MSSNAETAAAVLLPKDFNTAKGFYDTKFQNHELETITRNIIIVQEKMNPNGWTPFSFEDYKMRCTHEASRMELDILEVLTRGGKPSHDSREIDAGYLIKGEDGKYHVTEKLLEVIQEFKKEAQ